MNYKNLGITILNAFIIAGAMALTSSCAKSADNATASASASTPAG